jgi:hypothetical protein
MTWLIVESRHFKWCDSFWVPKSVVGSIGLTWHPISTWKWVVSVHKAWLLESRQTDWLDSKRPELRNKFKTGSFLNFLRKWSKYEKKIEAGFLLHGSLRCEKFWRQNNGHVDPPTLGKLGWAHHRALPYNPFATRFGS